MNVVERDFGKSTRDACRSMSRLLGLIEAQEQELLNDPVRLFDLAQKEIGRLHGILREANDSLSRPVAIFAEDSSAPCREVLDIIRVERSEWNRLKACAAIVEASQ